MMIALLEIDASFAWRLGLPRLQAGFYYCFIVYGCNVSKSFGIIIRMRSLGMYPTLCAWSQKQTCDTSWVDSSA